jgi:hypothetical protein
MNDQNKQIEYLIGLKRITSVEVRQMQEIMREFIDPKCSICPSCPGQIRFTQKRLASWYYANMATDVVDKIIVPDAEKKKGCSSCKKKTNASKK